MDRHGWQAATPPSSPGRWCSLQHSMRRRFVLRQALTPSRHSKPRPALFSPKPMPNPTFLPHSPTRQLGFEPRWAGPPRHIDKTARADHSQEP